MEIFIPYSGLAAGKAELMGRELVWTGAPVLLLCK